MSECPLVSGEENADILLDYCNRKLDPAMTAVFERHMEQCPACRAFADSQSAVWNALDAFEAMPISPDFDQRLWARIEAEEQGSWLTRFWNRITESGTAMWRPALPVAAALVLATGLWLRPVLGPTAETEPTVTATIDATEIETALEDMEMLRQLQPADTSAPKQM
jgi:anti-sigma factor RsiW